MHHVNFAPKCSGRPLAVRLGNSPPLGPAVSEIAKFPPFHTIARVVLPISLENALGLILFPAPDANRGKQNVLRISF